MNIYRVDFTSRCPVNGELIFYALEIRSAEMILTEKIQEAVNVEKWFHEELADKLHLELGGRQVMTARHGRVSIETIRGE